MTVPKINTATRVVPMIYAYSTPGVTYHNGWTKIGYTEQNVEVRIKQQVGTAGLSWKLEWQGQAVFDDGSGIRFHDTDFHAYLRKRGVEQEAGKKNEWFHITGPESKTEFYDFRENHGVLKSNTEAVGYVLRREQEDAVLMAKDYFGHHSQGEVLWNCKPRFGKTLAVYDLAKRMGAKTVLIVTNRPAISNSWHQDYVKFMGSGSGYAFVSDTDSLKGRADVLSRQFYVGHGIDTMPRCIEFLSLQDLKGSIYFGGSFKKLKEVADLEWDLLVVDEAHEGVDTYKTDVAFDRIKRKHTLHLSGTPFKALSKGKFAANAVFNWTYSDEQRSKAQWDDSDERDNPYAALPRMSMYTYKRSDIVKDKLERGIDIDGTCEDYAFDLNEFFATNEKGRFVHDEAVDKFLDALTRQKRYPFSTKELRNELKHTFWLLNRVDSAKALARKLNEHPIFKDYEVVLAAGDGRVDEEDERSAIKSYDKVKEAIAEFDKTITISVGQLTTGITVPEWTGVLMLCSLNSPALYMQAAFRAQNPCLFQDGKDCKRKTDAYIFDFDPARTLIIYEQFANDLSSVTAGGHGDGETRKKQIGELLNFFPVIGEDEEGELVELDAEKVLSIPRKIKSVEVVRRGFMSNFLFQNISAVFGAPKAVMEIIEKFQSAGDVQGLPAAANDAQERLSLDENGEVAIADEEINGKVSELFGKKIYDTEEIVQEASEDSLFSEPDDVADNLKKSVKENIVREVVERAKEEYGDAMRPSDVRRLESSLSAAAERKIDTVVANNEIERKVIEEEREEALKARFETGRSAREINREFDKRQRRASEEHRKNIEAAIEEIVKSSEIETVRTVETRTRERERDSLVDDIKDHLRGFARTIPAFLMAYGDEKTTLKTFDTIISDGVFKEVTGISLEEFRFLRDGGSYEDAESGEMKTFAGQLFDPVVFDDSVKEFMAKRTALSDYFAEDQDEDIFDYIPPQKTNQIFTPRKIVVRMVDHLEKENPGCFDNPDKTFVDLYMKSGMFITEIVKRLYRSAAMKRRFADRKERLRHIFEKQVYGLAPTEIIYRIAVNYILGFEKSSFSLKHNFRQLDALEYARSGDLKEKLSEVYEK